MHISKIVLTICFLILTNSLIFAQELMKNKCKEEDTKNNLLSSYEYNAADHYMVIKLLLYRDSTFQFTLSSFNRDLFSEGKWTEKDSSLILRSYLSRENIPVKLLYSDSLNRINNFKIGVIKNLKGEEMPDALALINNKSIKCIPSYGICNNDFKSIDSIKIYFESGPSSKWLQIEKSKYSQIIPIVQVNFLISNYMFFEDRKFRILKSSLKPIE